MSVLLAHLSVHVWAVLGDPDGHGWVTDSATFVGTYPGSLQWQGTRRDATMTAGGGGPHRPHNVMKGTVYLGPSVEVRAGDVLEVDEGTGDVTTMRVAATRLVFDPRLGSDSLDCMECDVEVVPDV